MKNSINVISPRNSRPSCDELKAMIKSTKGKFFSAEFIKANGSKRKIIARVDCRISKEYDNRSGDVRVYIDVDDQEAKKLKQDDA